MTEAIFYNDLKRLSGVIARGFDAWSAPVTLSGDRVASFCRITGARTPDGLIPGDMLQAMLPVLVPQRSWTIEGHGGALNIGSPVIRFPACAVVGESLRGRSRLVSVSTHPRGVPHRLAFEVKADGASKACLSSAIDLLYLEPGA